MDLCRPCHVTEKLPRNEGVKSCSTRCSNADSSFMHMAWQAEVYAKQLLLIDCKCQLPLQSVHQPVTCMLCMLPGVKMFKRSLSRFIDRTRESHAGGWMGVTGALRGVTATPVPNSAGVPADLLPGPPIARVFVHISVSRCAVQHLIPSTRQSRYEPTSGRPSVRRRSRRRL